MKILPKKYSRLVTLLLFAFASFNGNAQVKEDFTPRYNNTINGGVTIIANNTISRTATGEYDGTDGNHDFTDNVYVDIDNDSSTFNSSSATLENPEPSASCLEIESVLLYWAAGDKGLITNGNEAENQPTWDFDDVKLRLPGQSTYTTVTADEVIFRGRDEVPHFEFDPYVCVKDITNEVKTNTSGPFGTYQVANVEGREGFSLNHTESSPNVFPNTGTSGGWQIVVVYKSPDLTRRNITLFDGYANVTDLVNNFDINVSGFQTVPNGNVIANVVIGSLEGDRDLDGDRLQIIDTNGVPVDISTNLRLEDNFFNSSITVGNSNFVDRNPASTNTLGFDAGVFSLVNGGNNIIDNDQTSATFRLTSTTEAYGLFLLGLSIEVYEPKLDITFVSNPSSITPANSTQIVTNTISLTNNGNDDANNTTFTANIPLGSELDEPIDNLPSGVTYSYNNTTRELTFTAANGLLDSGDTLNISYLTIVSNCYFLENGCSSSLDSQVVASYVGNTNPESFNSLSSSSSDSCSVGNELPTSVSLNNPEPAEWVTAGLDASVFVGDSAALNNAQSLTPVASCPGLTPIKTSGPFVQSGPNPQEGSYTNTWTFTDACGNTIDTFTQTIFVLNGLDSDADGVIDANDFDDDNDGILDVTECQGFELVNNSNLTDEGNNVLINNLPGWNFTGGGDLYANGDGINIFADIDNGGITTQSINQFITGFNINADNEKLINISIVTNHADGSNPLGPNTVTVRFGGVLYAIINIPAVSTPGVSTVSYVNGAFGNLTTIPLNPPGGSFGQVPWQLSLPVVAPANGFLVIRANPNGAIAGDVTIGSVSIDDFCTDSDNDGVLDILDLDSDNDTCPDFVEGGAAFTEEDNGETALGVLTDGNGNLVTTNLGNNVVQNTNSPLYGVPIIAGNGQNIGTSIINETISIDTPLADIDTFNGSTVTFTVDASGSTTNFSTNTTTALNSGDLIYQWFEGTSTTPLTNNATYQGTNTNQLTIIGVTTNNTYTVLVTTANNNCGAESTANLTACEVNFTNVNISTSSPTTCIPANDGSILITNSGLNPNSSYIVTYVQGGSTTTVTPNPTANATGDIEIGNLEPGTYTNITVTSLNNSSCTDNLTGTFTIPDFVSNLTTGANSTDETCNNCDDGTLTSTPTGGSGNYSNYVWDLISLEADGSSQTAIYNTQAVSNVPPGTYQVTCGKGGGCRRCGKDGGSMRCG